MNHTPIMSEHFDKDDFIFSQELPLDLFLHNLIPDENSAIHNKISAFEDTSKSLDPEILVEIRNLEDDNNNNSFDSELLYELIEK